ncbi:MAG: acetate--CoA ligase family protein, partial [Pseudomonadota bacterium]
AIRDSILGLKMAPLLTGYRNKPALDLNAAVHSIMRLADLMQHNPHCLEVELNPLMVCVQGKGVMAADAVLWVEDDG